MPLIQGKQTLEKDLLKIYNQSTKLRTTREWARDKVNAIHKYCKSGIPMVKITNIPGGVVSGLTIGPVTGFGLGGFDKPSPGIGLEAAKPLLKAALIAAWSHGGSVKPYSVVAKQTAEAIHNYYSQAIIQTIEKSPLTLPCPPTSGPAFGPMKGKGGVLTSNQGNGFTGRKLKPYPPNPVTDEDDLYTKDAKMIFTEELIRIWDQIDWKNPISVSQFATELSEAIHAFCIEAKIVTEGFISAPASVDSLTGSGSYSVGSGIGKGSVT